MVQNRYMAGQRTPLLVKLEDDVTDGSVPLADLLRTCVVLGGRTGSTRLGGWAASELKGYPDQASVPAYRVLNVPILTETCIISTQRMEREIWRDHSYTLRLRESIDTLEALASSSEARGKSSKIRVERDIIEQHNRGIAEFFIKQYSTAPDTYVEDMQWLIEPPLIRGILGQIRTALAEFIVELRAEAGDADELPSSSQTDKAFQIALPSAIFANSTVTIMATGKGDFMPEDERIVIKDNKTTVKGSSGNVSVASVDVTQTNREVIDFARIREFGELIRQISPILGFTSGQEAELQTVADVLTCVADLPALEVGRIRRLLDRALKVLRTVGSSAARNLAINMGDELIREIGSEVIRDMPH